ncbi:tripartite tricarboxylate transporter permease [Gammaproteobacteria bacterium]|nr:tripartite tricarboxylate transporter permease [Gammaproteobacteria bacterium]
MEVLLAGLEEALRVDTFVWISGGLLLGMLMGSLPGFTTTMGMSVLVPISFLVGDPLIGIPFLIGVYKGGIYGGSVPAILISMPGTGASIATVFDGHELTKKGKARKALEMGLYASAISDFFSDIFTLVMIVPVAAIVLGFGPPEIASIMFLSLVIIAVTSTGPVIKGLLMLCLGVWFGLIGADPFSGAARYTFGTNQLYDGFHLIPMLIGLFALPEIFNAVKEGDQTNSSIAKFVGEHLRFNELKRSLRTIFRSTAIGTLIGLVPGLGQPIAAMMGYIAAKNSSKTPEKFGKGELDGVAGSEAANNAVNGPTMVPLLTLGIPGDAVTALLLGAFMMQGLRPGPTLLETNGEIVFAILIAMVFANILFLIIGYLTIPLFTKVVTIKRSLLIPVTIMLAFAGTYLARSNPFDIVTLIGFGLVGIAARTAKFDVAPMVMGFILGRELEYSFGQTLALAGDDWLHFVFVERIGMTAVVLATPIVGIILGARMKRFRQRAIEREEK